MPMGTARPVPRPLLIFLSIFDSRLGVSTAELILLLFVDRFFCCSIEHGQVEVPCADISLTSSGVDLLDPGVDVEEFHNQTDTRTMTNKYTGASRLNYSNQLQTMLCVIVGMAYFLSCSVLSLIFMQVSPSLETRPTNPPTICV